MKLNRKGVTRLVIELEKVVIKIPNFTRSWQLFLRGLIGNIEEWKIWKYNEKKRYLLCPVVWRSWGGWILIMRKAHTYTEKEWDDFEVDISEHKKYFAGDDKVCNYGIYMGQIVKIDYADMDEYWGDDCDENGWGMAVKDKHDYSPIECSLCTHKWIAVRPTGVDVLECPNCNNMTNI